MKVLVEKLCTDLVRGSCSCSVPWLTGFAMSFGIFEEYQREGC